MVKMGVREKKRVSVNADPKGFDGRGGHSAAQLARLSVCLRRPEPFRPGRQAMPSGQEQGETGGQGMCVWVCMCFVCKCLKKVGDSGLLEKRRLMARRGGAAGLVG